MNRNRKRETEAVEGSGFSLYQLGHLNQNLNSDCEQTHRLREQIVQVLANIENLAIHLRQAQQGHHRVHQQSRSRRHLLRLEAGGREAQACSHGVKKERLSALVEHYEKLIYEEKVSKYEEMKQKKAADEYEKWRSKLKQTEKNYDHIVLKANSSSYEVTKKIDHVRTLRSERTILNGLFDQFERELFEIELKYKVRGP